MSPNTKILARIGLAVALIALVIVVVKKFFWIGLLGLASYFFATRFPRLLKAAAKCDDEARKQ